VAITPAGTISFRYNYAIHGRQETTSNSGATWPNSPRCTKSALPSSIPQWRRYVALWEGCRKWRRHQQNRNRL
jgi:hypothetical protein